MITLYNMMCDKDFFNATAKAVLKKEDGNFQFGKANKDYYWLITNMYDATLEIDLIERDKSILMHVNKNHKSGKDMKFPLTDDFEEDYDEMLDYIFRFLMNEFGAEWYESNKSVKKSLREGIDIKIVYCDDTPSEYIDDVTMNDIYDILDSSSDICKIVDVSGSKKKVVWTDEYGFERAYESKKSARKSLTEKMLQDICNAWVIGKVKGEFKGRDYCHEGNDYSLYNIGNIIEDALRDNYIVEFDGDDKTKTVIFNLINKDGKNVGTLEIFPDERYSAENYEDGFNWEDLNMKEIIKDFEDTLGYRIEYLKNDKRFDYSDRFWYKESKKSVNKSLKEGIDETLIGESKDGQFSLYLSDQRRANHGKDPHYEIILATNGYFTKYVRTDDKKAERVVSDWITLYDIDLKGVKFSELFESKKSARKSMNEKVDSKYKKVFDHRKDEYEIMQFDDYNFEILAVPNGKSIFSDDLPKFAIEKTYIYDTCKNATDVTLFVGIVEELGWCFIAFDKLANNDNIFAYYISGKDKHDAYMAFHEYKSEFDLINESKKSMKESFDDGDQLVIDVVDMLIIDFGYDKKTVEKYFYKIHKLNDFDTISIDEYIKIKEEIEKALGYDNIF